MADLQSNKLTLTKIANGTSGKGILGIVEQYAINNDGSNPPQESSQDWSSSYTPPTAINRYLWNREVITYTDSSSEITTPHVAAMYAEDGGEGRGISGISNLYAISNNGDTAPASGWESSPMAPTSAAKYLWNKEIITYTKGTPATTETARVIGTYSADGAPGAPGTNGLNQATVYLYARQDEPPSAPSSALTYRFSTGAIEETIPQPWSQTFPQNNGNPCYMAIAVAISNEPTDTIFSNEWTVEELVQNGQNGQNGRGISSTNISYQVSDDGTYDPSGTWSPTVPQPIAQGKWLITQTVITYTDSTSNTSYNKAYIGEDGQPGSPGQPGADGNGISSTSIQYAITDTNVQPSTGWQPTLPSFGEGKWLWIKTTITYDNGNSDESVSKSYTGTDGQDGTSVTITNTSYDPVTKTTTITMNDGSGTPKTVSIKDGEDGNDGQPGAAGADGTPSYTHFAWANSADGQTDFSTIVSEGKLYIGVYSDSTQQDSQSPSSYSWTLIKGADGEDGEDGAPGTDGLNQATVYLYRRSATEITTAPTASSYNFTTGQLSGVSSGWTQTIPSGTDPCYVSSAIAISRGSTDTSLTFSTPAKLVEDGQDGQDGQDGAPGRGISSTEIKYIISDQGTVPPDDSENWLDNIPSTIAAGDYLWIRTIFTYTDGNPSRSYSVAREGQNGADGKDANSFTIHTNQNQVLKFTRQLDNNSNILYEFSLPELQINAYSLIDNLNIEHQMLPAPSVYYSIDVEVDGLLLSSIIKTSNYTEYVETRSGDVYSYFFDYQSLYTDLVEGTISSKIQAETTTERDNIIESLKNFFDSRDSKDIHIIGNVVEGNSIYTIEKYVEFQNGISSDMMKFALNAANVNMAIENTGLTFDASGLTVTNGGFQILIQDGESEPQKVFYIDPNTKLLHVEGDGTFSGTIYARNGEFDGLITATEGTIGGFNINYNSISSQDLTLYPTSYTYPAVPGLTQASFDANKINYYYWDENKGRYIHCTNDSVYNSEITYHSLGEAVESHIDVKNINIGSGAVVDGQITVGNLKITNPSNNENKVITLVKDGENYFTLTNNGDLIGNNWSIAKENGTVTARFGKLIADDGVFNGTIYATDGRFTGEIVASVINASTINTANFITEKTRSMGGTFIFKPTFDIVELTGIGNNIIEITPSSNFNSGYLPEIISGKDIIISLSGFDTRYGKFNSINNGKIRVEFLSNDYQTILNSSGYNSFIIFGYGNYTDVLIGINSDDTNVIMPPRALVMEEFSNLVSGTSGIINYNTRLLLGDLSSIQNIVGSNPGYGLFADNVFLRGSLTTANVQDVAVYAGVNTQRAVDFNYTFWNQEPPSDDQTNEKIVFWGGANSTSDDSITKAPFIVTDKGSIYARSGEFKGSVISDSLITKSIIKAPVIYGNNTEGTDPSLKIYNTDINNNGIGFYKLVKAVDIESNEVNDVLTLTLGNTGFTHYYEDQIDQFISFNDKYVYAKGLTQDQFNANKTNYYKLNSYNQYIQCSSTESFDANEWYFTLNSSNYINFKGTKYTAGTTTEITEHYIQDGNSLIQLGGESFNGTKISYGNNSDITITENNIVNNSTIVTNKKSMIITDDTRSLKYTVNSSGYYCLFVQ